MSNWLIVTHLKTQASHRFELPSKAIIVGRTVTEPSDLRIQIDSDPMLSRQHFLAEVGLEGLKIQRLENKHPLYFQGTVRDEFVMQPGQLFTSGQSSFEYRTQSSSLGQPTSTGTMLLDLNQLREFDSERCLGAVLALQPVLNQFHPEKDLLALVLPILAEIVPMASAIFIMASVGQDFREESSYGERDLAPSRTLLRQAITGKEPVCYSWDGLSPSIQATLVGGSRWAVACPLILPAGEAPDSYVLYAVGSETAINSRSSGRTPGDLDRAVLTFAAGLLAEHLRGRRTIQEVENERRKVLVSQSLHRVLTSLTSTLDFNEIVSRLQVHLKELVGYDRVEQVSQITLDSEKDGFTLPLRLQRLQETHGFLVLYRSRAEFSAEEIRLAESLADGAAVALDNASLYKTTERLAIFDELTQVHNRRYFFQKAEELVQRCQESGEQCSVAILDVDHFKKFNDTYGHAFGDAVLQVVARLGASYFIEPAIFARYGGEEFAVAAAVGPSHLLERLQHCRQTIADHQETTEGLPVSVTISAGLSSWHPDIADLKTVLAQADQALYQAKASGRNRVIRFSP